MHKKSQITNIRAAKGQNAKFVKLDEVQFEELKECILKTKYTEPKRDLFSEIIKWILVITFILLGVFLFTGTILCWSTVFAGFLNKLLAFAFLIYSALFVLLGIDIIREKDRNYLITIASMLISFVALVIAWIK